MTRLLLDTHCFLWAATAPDLLRPSAVAYFDDANNDIALSSVSVAEIALKSRIGKLKLPRPAETFVPVQMDELRLTMLPLFMEHAFRVASLPRHHGDPFDLLLIAQCQAERVPLMTADVQLAAYDIDIIWAGRGPAPEGPRISS